MKDTYIIHSGDHEGRGILYRHIVLVQAKHTYEFNIVGVNAWLDIYKHGIELPFPYFLLLVNSKFGASEQFVT
jgi:hypothetical protein